MDRYAVIGHPVKHSLSPFIHAEFAKQTKQDLIYEAIEAPVDGFKKVIEQFRHEGGKGANVTLPFKIEAYQIADQHSLLAQQAGAANTLAFHANHIFADSTDGIGLVKDLAHHHYSLSGKTILILGAGGAVRTVLGPLLNAGVAHCIIANRTSEKALGLASEFQNLGSVVGVGFDKLNGPFDLIINATSAGLTGDFIALPDQLISSRTVCYDLMYGAKKSAFLTWAEKNNAASCLDGLGMLVEQAAAAFFLWRGVYPETQSVLEMLKN